MVLGDGGPAHQRVVRDLRAAGANRRIADNAGDTPLDLARACGYAEMIALLEAE